MEIRLEPKKLIIGNEQSKGYKVLNQASWLPFLHKFSGYNLEVTRQFASIVKLRLATLYFPF